MKNYSKLIVIFLIFFISAGEFFISCKNNGINDANTEMNEAFDQKSDCLDSSIDISEFSESGDNTQQEDFYTGAFCGPNCRQITFRDVGVYKIWENIIVYGEYPTEDIYIIDLTTGQETFITSCKDEEYEGCADATIYKNYIYYFRRNREPPYKQCDLWRYNILTREKEIIHTIRSEYYFGILTDLNANDNYVLWADDRNAEINRYAWELYLLNLSTGEESRLTNGSECMAFDVRMWKNKVVFTERRGGDHEIILYDIEKNTFTNISNNIYDQYQPAIWEDRVVWIDSRTEQSQGVGSYYNPHNPDVYFKQIEGELVAVETEGSIQRNPDIFGNLIVWDDERNDDTPNTYDTHIDLRSEVFVYDISTGEKIMITQYKDKTGGEEPRIWENRIFFLGRDKNNTITLFMYEL